LTLVLCFCVSASFAAPNAAQAFNAFKFSFNKNYSNPVEEVRRFQIFQQNIQLVDKWNAELKTEAFDVVSPFADMTQEEFMSQYLLSPTAVQNSFPSLDSETTQRYQPEGLITPSSESPLLDFDWSYMMPESITPVKDQSTSNPSTSSCNSLQFAAAALLESRWVINGNKQVAANPFSPNPSTLSCSPPNTVAMATGYDMIQEGGAHLYSYVSNVAPAAVAVDASRWFLYKGRGTLLPAAACSSDAATTPNHVAIVTGYTNIDGVNVWKIRNSWGPAWGHQGYIYVPMDACGVSSNPAFGVQTSISSDDNPILGTYYTTCLNTVNMYRQKANAPNIAYNNAQQTCSNNQAKYDFGKNVAHAGFGQCQEYGQCECPGWGSVDQIASCLQMMYNEGPPPAGQFNHYSIMTNKDYKSLVCGFYTGKTTWMLKDYYF